MELVEAYPTQAGREPQREPQALQEAAVVLLETEVEQERTHQVRSTEVVPAAAEEAALEEHRRLLVETEPFQEEEEEEEEEQHQADLAQVET